MKGAFSYAFQNTNPDFVKCMLNITLPFSHNIYKQNYACIFIKFFLSLPPPIKYFKCECVSYRLICFRHL